MAWVTIRRSCGPRWQGWLGSGNAIHSAVGACLRVQADAECRGSGDFYRRMTFPLGGSSFAKPILTGQDSDRDPLRRTFPFALNPLDCSSPGVRARSLISSEENRYGYDY